MNSKSSGLDKEALRLQAGGRRRRLMIDLGGVALEGWEALVTRAQGKGVKPEGVLTLLILHGGTQVERSLVKLPEPSDGAGKGAGKGTAR